ncbi:DUF4435 domain-containing protein (plasmid) [Bacillus mycoides]|uniref:DUF4435 domain-containing protein n=1 Tax=Bacillus cereus group TaxID=86661 RepID=UPI001C01841C|nr:MULTISPECIES: DUF4435 domain-containing protein [Bacillus cereus group]MDM5460026.1 DUF4435 domain-containing protein [Bacillus cereus]QWG48081.1 DUF4435 domain-containing protein [Bacillus mycoides]
MSYRIKLPDENNQVRIEELENNAFIIVGANGSGKSRLGAWIEQQDFENIHRISAQRSLIFKDFIDLKSYVQSENILFFGEEKGDRNQNKGYRWNWGKYTTTMVDDFDAVLSTIIAKRNLQNEKYLDECRTRDIEGKSHDKVPVTVVDHLYDIWAQIYPHRKISIRDAQVIVEYNQKNYKGIEMSDGERVALYLIAQCLAMPNNTTIIIDEPEVHLHRSIMNCLWKAIEKVRQDCVFIYITHDTYFAASHEHAKKLWVKEYDGNNWGLAIVNIDGSLPEQCLLDILGNRKSTIFVEGTAESFDTAIYREIYKDYYIVPCGSSINVIEYTKSMNSNNQLHHLKAYGIVDRDFRSEAEIKYLHSQGIFVLNIAEVENLFCIEEVLQEVNKHFVFNNNSRIETAKKYVIEDRFNKQISQQIAKAITSQVKYKLTKYDVSGNNIEEIENKLNNIQEYIKFSEIFSLINDEFYTILHSKDYAEVLKVFNEKGLSSSIGSYFGVNNREYCDLVLRLLQKGNEKISMGMKRYLPDL